MAAAFLACGERKQTPPDEVSSGGVFSRAWSAQPCLVVVAVDPAPTAPASRAIIVGVVRAIARSVVRAVVIAVRATVVIVRISAGCRGAEREGAKSDPAPPTTTPPYFGGRGFRRRLLHHGAVRAKRQGHRRACRAQGDRAGNAERERTLHREYGHDVLLSLLRSRLKAVGQTGHAVQRTASLSLACALAMNR